MGPEISLSLSLGLLARAVYASVLVRSHVFMVLSYDNRWLAQPLALGLLPVRSVPFGSFSGGRGGSYSDSIRFVAGEGYSLRIRFILDSYPNAAPCLTHHPLISWSQDRLVTGMCE